MDINFKKEWTKPEIIDLESTVTNHNSPGSINDGTTYSGSIS